MHLEQAFEIPSAADRVWRGFNDIEAVVGCLPGASLRAPPDNGKLQLSMVVKLGPITANFVGDGEVHLDDATKSGTVSGGATDRKGGSRIKGQVAFVLTEPLGPGTALTRVALTIDYTMGGTLAQFSREGIVRDLAQRLTDTFASNLRKTLEEAEAVALAAANDPVAFAQAERAGSQSTAATSAPDPSAPNAAATSRTSAEPASLNFAALLWAALRERVRRLFRRRSRV